MAAKELKDLEWKAMSFSFEQTAWRAEGPMIVAF
jgi:hypothetical protein